MTTGSKAYPWFVFTVAVLSGSALLAQAASLDLASARKVRREVTRLETRLAVVEPDASLVRGVQDLVHHARALEICLRRANETGLDCRGDAVETIHRFDRISARLRFEAQESAFFARQFETAEKAIESLRSKVEGPWDLDMIRVNAVIEGQTFQFSGRFRVEILTACVRDTRAAGLLTASSLIINGDRVEIASNSGINTVCRLVAEVAE